MDCATWGPFIVTLGKAGQMHIYNYIEKRLILAHNFNDIGSQIIWFPCQVKIGFNSLFLMRYFNIQ